MTREFKKICERLYVEDVAERLGKKWLIGPDRESPDFIITEGSQKFGLEVCEAFNGRHDEAGAYMKKIESDKQKIVDGIKLKYDKSQNTPLHVRFIGDMCADNIHSILNNILEKDFSAESPGYQSVFCADKGRGRLRVHVTVQSHPHWYSVNDRAGFVNRNPEEEILRCIGDKALKLPFYKNNSCLSDIRLLIVANRIMNSGKMSLTGQPTLRTCGFSFVYFLSHPETVTVFAEDTSAV